MSELASVRQLIEQGIDHKLFVHAGPVRSLEQAAAERNQKASQVVRSLLFRLAKDQFALVLVAGPAQIPWKTLRTFFEQRRLSQASPEEVLAVTGYKIGTVSPFGLATKVPIYIDKSVMLEDDLSMGSGKSGQAIVMSTQEFLRALPQAEHISLFDQ